MSLKGEEWSGDDMLNSSQ